jgi:hypothetical protein
MCGWRDVAPPACSQCPWPMSHEAWSQTTYVIRKVTLDTSCINQHQADDDLNQLEQWAGEGLFELQRSTAMLPELRGGNRIAKAGGLDEHNRPWLIGVAGRSEIGVTTFVGGPDLSDDLANLLFPTTATINSKQQADVDHLQSHIHAGADMFITKDLNDFIKHGKQVELSMRGLWVFDPHGAIAFLRDLYHWQ